MIKNKKGIQLNEAFVSVLTLVLIGVLIVVALYLLGSLGTSMQTHDTAATVVNETGVWLNVSGYTLSKASALDFASPSVTAIWNRSASGNYNVSIPATNATISATGVITNTTSYLGLNNVSVSYTYTYTSDSAATNATNDTIDQFATYPALIGLIGTIIFLGIVIGVLVMSFMPKNSP